MSSIFEAIRSGKQLAKSTTWKNAQASGSAIAAVAGFVFTVLPMFGVSVPGISPDLVSQISTGVALVVAGVLNAYITVATTETIGLPPIGKPGDSIPDAGPTVTIPTTNLPENDKTIMG